MRYLRFLIISFVIAFSSIAVAGNYSKLMFPTQKERLSNPISLIGACKNIKIIEWRHLNGYKYQTGVSKSNLKIINDICNLAVYEFPKFAKANGYELNFNKKFKTKICIMPAKLDKHGADPRNLNDLQHRFSTRHIKDALWGFYNRLDNYLYVRNDIKLDNGKENSRFKTIFAHELFHALSYQYGMYSQYLGNNNKIDEYMARQFTDYIGLGT